MVVFRKDEAEIVLNQTGSIEKAKRELDILPTGGGTPLADGLYKSLEIALKAKKINLQSVIIILTDGRANIPMNKDIAMMLNNVRQDAVRKEIILLGDSYKKYNIKSLIIDTRSVYSTKSEAFQIANLINAQYFHLPIVTTDEVVKLVRNAL
jgi:magnesium chelatase subunit D